MKWICNTHKGNKKCMQKFLWETSREKIIWALRHRQKDNIKMDLENLR
jgi:hypothetical protein